VAGEEEGLDGVEEVGEVEDPRQHEAVAVRQSLQA
jgi:hypothetical protein